MSTVFNTNPVDVLKEPMFFGSGLGIARYDIQRHKVFEDLTEKQLSFFWRPEEVNLMMDAAQFNKLPQYQQDIFTNNLKYQSLLDSIQGRAPSAVLMSLISDPSLDTWVATWTFSETIHSRSYTHIMRNLYTDPSKVFDEIVLDKAIMKRAESIGRYYDDVLVKTREYQNAVEDYEGILSEGFRKEELGKVVECTKRALMKSLYLCLHVINALEAIRFYVSFACTFNFHKNMEIMEGNAKIMKFIARDEQLHLKGTQYIIRQLQLGTDGDEWVKIAQECEQEAVDIFMEVNRQEKDWAVHLFKDGDVPGLNTNSMWSFIDYLTVSRMKQCGLPCPITDAPVKHPYPWIREYLNSDNVQSAPQEVELSSYLVAQIDNDVDDKVMMSFKKYF
ncbi:ribonucleotide reductase of class Ia, beta subunit [Yersinia phage vB_YepM_ZN18]|jgi:ribonucleoside-diphosphate reductase beta chain|uniref:ribonucleoside-diphosphate reductase n=10 Tax=Tequatrovirus TaxID=10663 RepID=A0A6B9WFM3_9CAUD|nr:class Ia ribonucleoside-diphosphate reductase subunit beta [Escherichia coli]YP_004415121.1 ribonucleotide reductase class Ia beta subunit [Shigella phage Shfl2]YP_007004603.1 ribonucleotide reductase class Ia beta subunit [Escherichia phage ime09]YP_009290492.1 ribonucleotide reductase class Ia beta subunit [Escherichia phage vB_EcoM-UFV13]YP_010068135.1 ribonucleotide reductase class Ia beta subunit [Escherichia phage EcNP1]YP_010073603.1 ribonucleotide reductase class Ia beta subunit [Es